MFLRLYEVGDRLFSEMIAIDVLVANVWMACLLFAAGRAKQIDTRVGADTSTIDDVKTRSRSSDPASQEYRHLKTQFRCLPWALLSPQSRILEPT
jgi:Protein of unknown function (DUF819)